MVIERAPLEDELGDVLEKAARLRGLTLEVVAARAGVEVHRVEDAVDYRSELTGAEIDRLAAALGLLAAGLRAVASGRYPLPEIAGLPCCLYPLRLTHGIGVANAYVVADCGRERGILFYAGTEPEALRRAWPETIRGVEAVFITHPEAEHLGGLAEVRRRCGDVPVFGPGGAADAVGGVTVGDGAEFEFGGFRVRVWRTPGHSETHNCYVVTRVGAKRSAPLLISGDLLFAGSVGGAYFCEQRLTESLVRLVGGLPSETIVAPGHGPLTTLANEREHNPFLAGGAGVLPAKNGDG